MTRQPITGKGDVILGYIIYSSNGIRWVSAELTSDGVKRFTNDFRRKKK